MLWGELLAFVLELDACRVAYIETLTRIFRVQNYTRVLFLVSISVPANRTLVRGSLCVSFGLVSSGLRPRCTVREGL